VQERLFKAAPGYTNIVRDDGMVKSASGFPFTRFIPQASSPGHNSQSIS